MRNPYLRRGDANVNRNTSQVDLEHQYQHFLQQLQQHQMLWSIAEQQSWTLCRNDQTQQAMLLWNMQADAQRDCLLSRQGAEPKAISADLLRTQILPYLIKQNYLVAINRSAKGECVFVSPERLIADMG